MKIELINKKHTPIMKVQPHNTNILFFAEYVLFFCRVFICLVYRNVKLNIVERYISRDYLRD